MTNLAENTEADHPAREQEGNPDERVWRERWRRFRQKLRESTPYLIISSLLFLFILAYLFHRIFITVPAGHAGVLYKWFQDGTDVNSIYGEGLQIIAPWNRMTIYNLRIQEVDQDFNVLTADGLAIETTMSIRFRPTRRLLGMLHKEHGPDYIETYLVPELGSSARRVIGLVTPIQFYSSDRDSVEQAIDEHLRRELREIDEFINTEWPNPPGYYEYFSYLDSVNMSDELKAAVFDSLNLSLIVNSLRDSELRQQIESVGLLPFFFHLQAENDSLLDVQEEVARRLEAARGLLFDSESERESGFYDLFQEEGDAVIKVRVDSLEQMFNELEREKDRISPIFDAIMTQYDRFFTVVDIHDVLVKNILLPPQIAQAIQNKLEQEQIAHEFKFRLIRERKEAERKRIEAKGIKDFQDTIATGITNGLLRWKGIEATLKMAESENSKIVIIGAGEEGLPIILGNLAKD
jgi:regulator of protease activity HflC (stomatin/prohibitin superfamily)